MAANWTPGKQMEVLPKKQQNVPQENTSDIVIYKMSTILWESYYTTKTH